MQVERIKVRATELLRLRALLQAQPSLGSLSGITLSLQSLLRMLWTERYNYSRVVALLYITQFMLYATPDELIAKPSMQKLLNQVRRLQIRVMRGLAFTHATALELRPLLWALEQQEFVAVYMVLLKVVTIATGANPI